jgi:hypothetical protein
MDLFCSELIRHAEDVLREDLKIQGPRVVLRIAVTARVPGSGFESRGKELELPVPAMAITADAVQEEDERPLARDRDREPRRGADEDGVQGYSAFAPEILTARARLSLSLLM